MSDVKKPKQITKNIGGIDFTFQHPGVRKAIQINDNCRDDKGRMLSELYFSELMEHVIVSPKTTWDFWEDDNHFEVMDEVMAEAARFLNTRKG